MKKILALILALCMIMTLAPAAFAAGATTETQEYSGITVKYDFTNFKGAVVYNKNDSTTWENGNVKNVVDYLKSYGFWIYHSRYGGNPSGRVCQVKSESWLYLQAAVGDWVAFEINVPKAGKYDISLEHGIYTSSAADAAGMWILPLTNSDTEKEYTDAEIDAALTDDTALTQTIDFYGDKNTSQTIDIGSYTFPSEGIYLVVYKSITAGNGGHMYPGTLTLDGDGAGVENAIPMSMVTSVDNAELKVGSDAATAQMSADVYMSNLSTVTDGITYTSSDENVATVDEAGLITAKTYGTAKVTASATIGDYTLENSEEITVNADGISIAYNVGTDACTNASNGFLTALTYDYTNGFYRYVGTNSIVDNGNNKKDEGETSAASHLKWRKNNVQINGAILIALEVYIPQAGIYTMEMKNGEYASAGKVEVYMTTEDKLDLTYKKEVLGTKLGEYVCDNDNVSGVFDKLATNQITGIAISEPGYYVLSFFAKDGYGSLGDFTLISGTGETVPMPAMIKVCADELTVGDTTSIVGAAAYLSDGSEDATKTASGTYTSSDTSVITVDGTTITAVGAGSADIITTVGGETVSRTITVEDVKVGGTASFGVYSDVANSVTVKIGGSASENVIESVTVGTTVEATAATEVEGYIFRGWKRGSADRGVWLTSDATVKFPLMTNTFLTAVYDVDTAETDVNVEFYNYNGQYLGKTENVGENEFSAITKPTAALTGYSNPFWTLDGKNEIANETIFTKLTRVVAMYNDKDSFDVTIGEGITGAATGTFDYDTELALTSASEGTWYVNGKPAAYGSTYKHCVWDAATITFAADKTTAPIISLDGKTKTNGARMISYDANGADIVEVGILFGNNATVSSFSGKAASKAKGDVQDQFTAQPSGEEIAAKGYLIYNDNGTYRVIYAD